MPRRKKSSKPQKDVQFKPVWIDFSENERKHIVQLGESEAAELGTSLEEWTTDGWKVSLSYSAGWGAFVCSISTKSVEPYNDGSVYMFRHPRFSRAVGFLGYFFGHMVENTDVRLEGDADPEDW